MISVSEQEIIDRLLEKGMTKEEIENEIKERIEEMNGLISRMGALKIIANDHNISLFKASESVRVRIKNLVGGLDDVTVYGRVTDIFPVKEFTRKKGGKGKVASMIITDETGTTRVVLWDNKTNILDKIKIGDVVKVVQARVRQGNFLELHTKASTRIMITDDEESKKIPKITNLDTIENSSEKTKVMGKVVHIFESNPFYETCPKCNRRATYNDGKWVCPEHGEFDTPRQTLKVNFILDDGVANIRCVAFGKAAEQLLGISSEEAYKIAEEHGDMFKPVRDKIQDIIGKEYIVRGIANINDFSDKKEIIVRSIREVNPERELERVLTT